jgi:hypothetical protein
MFYRLELVAVTAIALSCLLPPTLGCEREVRLRTTKQMTWECAAEHYMPAYPEAQPVRFRYVENPHHEVIQSGRGLCDQLKSADKSVVTVEFDFGAIEFAGCVASTQSRSMVSRLLTSEDGEAAAVTLQRCLIR